jgi:hydrogenase maturation protein HypF
MLNLQSFLCLSKNVIYFYADDHIKMKETIAFHILVTGLVQGVGFRAFVYRLARNYGLTGWVRNTDHHVEIFVQGSPELVGEFISDLKENPPSASIVDEILSTPAEITVEKEFRIIYS